MNRSARAHMELGIPLVMMAIIGALLLGNVWGSLAPWLRGVGVVVLAVIGLAGLLSLGRPSPMSNNAVAELLDDDHNPDEA